MIHRLRMLWVQGVSIVLFLQQTNVYFKCNDLPALLRRHLQATAAHLSSNYNVLV